jgi:hypothetical protein
MQADEQGRPMKSSPPEWKDFMVVKLVTNVTFFVCLSDWISPQEGGETRTFPVTIETTASPGYFMSQWPVLQCDARQSTIRQINPVS